MTTRIAFIVLLLAAFAPAMADTLFLKNGTTVNGKIRKITPESVEFQTDRSRKTYPRRNIKRITYGAWISPQERANQIRQAARRKARLERQKRIARRKELARRKKRAEERRKADLLRKQEHARKAAEEKARREEERRKKLQAERERRKKLQAERERQKELEAKRERERQEELAAKRERERQERQEARRERERGKANALPELESLTELDSPPAISKSERAANPKEEEQPKERLAAVRRPARDRKRPAGREKIKKPIDTREQAPASGVDWRDSLIPGRARYRNGDRSTGLLIGGGTALLFTGSVYSYGEFRAAQQAFDNQTIPALTVLLNGTGGLLLNYAHFTAARSDLAARTGELNMLTAAFLGLYAGHLLDYWFNVKSAGRIGGVTSLPGTLSNGKPALGVFVSRDGAFFTARFSF